MKYLIYIGFCASFFIFTSCLDAERKGYYREIDSMLFSLDSLEQNYQAQPTDSFSIIMNLSKGLEKEVKTHFNEDTIDTEFARKMNRLRGIRKGSQYIEMKKYFLDTIFVFQKNQLTTLREDIEKSAGKRDAYASFVDRERENMGIISGAIKDFTLRNNNMRFDYNDIRDDIESRLENWKSKPTKK
jgi:chromosome segregation ATPase